MECCSGAIAERAGLSQEALAERAGLTAQGISALERGLRRGPYRETVRLLAEALGLSREDRASLDAAVTRRRGPSRPAAPPDEQQRSDLLPAAPNPLIGREHDEAAAVHLLTHDETRLLTLTGPGGVGKTRLAMQVAEGLHDRYADGVVFVRPRRAAQLFGVSAALRAATGTSMAPVDHAAIDTVIGRVRVALGDEDFTQARAAGGSHASGARHHPNPGRCARNKRLTETYLPVTRKSRDAQRSTG